MRAATAGLAAAVLVLAASAGQATAAAVHRQPVTVREVLGWCKAGDSMGIDGHTYRCVQVAPASAAARREPSCAHQLAVLRHVAGQGGVEVGSTVTAPITGTGPRTWARELRSVRLGDLAATALGIHDSRSDADYVMALQATAAAVLQGSGNCTK
jgi:hypothetical protein